LTHLGRALLQIGAAQNDHFVAFCRPQIPVLMGLSWEPGTGVTDLPAD
jgi:hypothetical protein